MKANIHPDYHTIIVVMTDGTEYKTRSTWGKEGDIMRLDIDSLSHPAWRGGATKITEKGQLSKFEKRFGSFLSVGVQTVGRNENNATANSSAAEEDKPQPVDEKEPAKKSPAKGEGKKGKQK